MKDEEKTVTLKPLGKNNDFGIYAYTLKLSKGNFC